MKILLFLIASLAAFSSTAEAKWKIIHGDESPIKLVGWPSEIDMIFKDGGYNANYSQRIFNAYSKSTWKRSTFIFLAELQPGFYWSSEWDIRESFYFKKVPRFRGATILPDQDTMIRFEDRGSQFKVLKFEHRGESCSFVHYSPRYGDRSDSGGSEFNASVVVMHCGQKKSFLRTHFKLDERRNVLKITHPDFDGTDTPRASSSPFKTGTPKSSAKSIRPIAVRWEGYDELFAGKIEHTNAQKLGDFSIKLPRNEGTCAGKYQFNEASTGTWSVACTNGLAASGTLMGFGSGNGSSGEGWDASGKSVKFTIGALQ